MPKNSQPVDSHERMDSHERTDSHEPIKSPSHLDDAILSFAREEGARLKARHATAKPSWFGCLSTQPWRSGLAVFSIACLAVAISLQDVREPANEHQLDKAASDSVAGLRMERERESRQRMPTEARQEVAEEIQREVAATGVAAPARRQAAASAEPADIEEVIVTGSYIRSSAVEASSPVAVALPLAQALVGNPELQSRYIQQLSAVLQKGIDEPLLQAEDKERQAALLLGEFSSVQNLPVLTEYENRYRETRNELDPYVLPPTLQSAMELLRSMEFD